MGLRYRAADEAILKERARALATPLVDADQLADGLDVLLVAVGEANCAVDLSAIGAVLPIGELTPLPGAPPTLAGLANLGGQIMTVVDLGRLFGLVSDAPRIALRVDSPEGVLALGVDRYEGVTHFSRSQIASPPDDGDTAGRHFLDGVCSGGIGLIHVGRVLAAFQQQPAADRSDSRRTP